MAPHPRPADVPPTPAPLRAVELRAWWSDRRIARMLRRDGYPATLVVYARWREYVTVRPAWCPRVKGVG